MSTSKKILLFGGAFDPPHVGHELLIKYALENIELDELWVMPSFGHTFLKKMTEPLRRIEMCKLMIKEIDNPKVSLSDLEIKLQLNGATINTIKTLHTMYSDNWKFDFLIGSDQLPNFHKWESYKELLQSIKFYVYPRKGYPMQPWYKEMCEVKTNEISGVSSTEIRQLLKAGRNFSRLLNPKVAEYIKKQQLYQ